jgi:hypothetical protein
MLYLLGMEMVKKILALGQPAFSNPKIILGHSHVYSMSELEEPI